jgi:hypothetical protein
MTTPTIPVYSPAERMCQSRHTSQYRSHTLISRTWVEYKPVLLAASALSAGMAWRTPHPWT